MLPRMVVAGAAALAFAASAALLPRPLAAVECWRGWGYWIDAQTRAYKSGELLLVTKGPADWRPDQAVELYVLDRTTGRIARDKPPITVIPANPRTYYRGRSNYVGGSGEVRGAEDHLVFGLSHVAPPSAPLERLRDFNLWACGLERTAE